MKLFTLYSRINLVTTIAIFVLSAIAFYFLIDYIIIGQVDDDLKIEQREITTYTSEHNQPPEAVRVGDQRIVYTAVDRPYEKTIYETVVLYDSTEKEKGNYRVLAFGVGTTNNQYKVTVTKSLEQTDDLVQSIFYIILCTILLILVATFIINRLVLKKLWRPFYNTLEKLKTFEIGKKSTLKFGPSKIDEFTFMNAVLESTTSKAQHDYLLLKEFTENASHEMQTPLAIIRSKLDLLIQDEQLSADQSKAAQGAYEAIQKLSRMNHSLLLLTKIENNQFLEITYINLQEKIETKAEAFRELWEAKNISIQASLQPAFVQMNNELAEILLNNLLSNATRHNYENGHITITLTNNTLIISNSGPLQSMEEDHLFTRFYKPAQTNESNGLGLSIIKQICEVSNFKIAYQFHRNEHSFTIRW